MRTACWALLTLILLPPAVAQCRREVLDPALAACASRGTGRSVSLFQDTAVVGAPDADGGSACTIRQAGRLFVFRRSAATGAWQKTDELQGPVPTAGQRFGTTVAMHAGVIVATETPPNITENR